MTKSQSKLIAYFMTLIMLVGIWVPFAASAMMTKGQKMEHMHVVGDFTVSSVSSLSSANVNMTVNSEQTCNSCDGNMGEHDQNCTDSCCQSCVTCSGVATFIKAPVFQEQYVSIKPILPVATKLSVTLQLLERPPRNI